MVVSENFPTLPASTGTLVRMRFTTPKHDKYCYLTRISDLVHRLQLHDILYSVSM